MKLRISSPAFADGAQIPRRFTADGEDVSPALTWTEGPHETRSWVVLCEDPDAPRGVFTHWLAWDLPAGRRGLDEHEREGLVEGENDFGQRGWRGPSPPRGKPHRYVFRLFALDAQLGLGAGASRAELERAMEGHVLSEARVTGMYGR